MVVRADKNAPGPVEDLVNTVEEKAQACFPRRSTLCRGESPLLFNPRQILKVFCYFRATRPAIPPEHLHMSSQASLHLLCCDLWRKEGRNEGRILTCVLFNRTS